MNVENHRLPAAELCEWRIKFTVTGRRNLPLLGERVGVRAGNIKLAARVLEVLRKES
jgi:hypothetical protein